MASWEGAEVELYAQQMSVISLEYTKILPKNCGLQQVDCDQLLSIKGVTFKMGGFPSLFSAVNGYLVPFTPSLLPSFGSCTGNNVSFLGLLSICKFFNSLYFLRWLYASLTLLMAHHSIHFIHGANKTWDGVRSLLKGHITCRFNKMEIILFKE